MLCFGVILALTEILLHWRSRQDMATRPVVLPDTWSRDPGAPSWTDWKYHFENIAAVNSWSGEQKLQWLRVRLTGRAQKAVHHLTGDSAASYDATVKALDEKFEPASRKTLFQAEFQARKKKRSESWSEFADDLKTLAEKGFPDLEEKAREQLALHTYFQQLDPPQVAFSVKQKQPKNLDEAVMVTIEMKSYLPASASRRTVAMCQGEENSPVPVAPVSETTAKLTSLVERLVDRVEKLETSTRQQRRYPRAPRGGLCWSCGKPGHIAKNCSQTAQGQGN